jgi:NAD(P)-dependent dehydrogenase (short-subunit alcohol dehydrogenase family)
MENLKNKIAVITGGNSGIGYATAKEMKERGADVIITGRRKEAIDKAALALGATGIIADQSNMEDIDRLVETVNQQFGKIDILVINAGVSQFAPIETVTEKMFDEIIDLNLKGAYFTLSRFIPILNDGAAVVMLSSTSATTAAPQISVYSASKAAINAIVKVAALELAPRKIRVNAVSPGPVATAIMDKSGLGDDAMQDQIVSGIPFGRLGDSGEVAKLIAFLCSDDASFITGSEYIIDGGQAIS